MPDTRAVQNPEIDEINAADTARAAVEEELKYTSPDARAIALSNLAVAASLDALRAGLVHRLEELATASTGIEEAVNDLDI